MKKEKIYKEDVTWRVDPTILKEFKLLAIRKERSYSSYIEELMKRETEHENENKD